jgi:hypothetical protein
LETLARLVITHRRTAYHHPEGSGYIERFHRSLKEEEVWTAEYRSLAEAKVSIGRWIEEYNHDRPHRGVQDRTPHEAFLAFAVLTKNEGLACLNGPGAPRKAFRLMILEQARARGAVAAFPRTVALRGIKQVTIVSHYATMFLRLLLLTYL